MENGSKFFHDFFGLGQQLETMRKKTNCNIDTVYILLARNVTTDNQQVT
jgi:hypothetical protein